MTCLGDGEEGIVAAEECRREVAGSPVGLTHAHIRTLALRLRVLQSHGVLSRGRQ